MCNRQAPRHPICGHAAQGTAFELASLLRCDKAKLSGTLCPCVAWASYDLPRKFCDRCIIEGELVAQEQGHDAGVFCKRMGVAYSALRDANPGLLPRPVIAVRE